MQKHVVSVSGGKDSTAMYLAAMERLQGDFIPVFADTGNEHEITLEYVSRLADRTGGPEIQWVKADFRERIKRRCHYVAQHYEQDRALEALEALEATTRDHAPFFSLCLLKGMFPSRKVQFCTQELKQIPIASHIYAPIIDDGHEVVSWQGVRALESVNRSCLPMWEQMGDGVTAYRPLIGWEVGDVFAMHRRHGIPPNPLYKLGMGRVGCMPCINARKEEIAEISKRFPEHIQKIREWEKWVQQVSATLRPTFFHNTKMSRKSDTRANIDNVVSWSKTVRGGKRNSLLSMLPPTACMSQYGLCE